MPSRQLLPLPPLSTADLTKPTQPYHHHHHHRHHNHLLTPLIAVFATTSLLLLLFLLFLRHTLRRKHTAPSLTSVAGEDSKPPHRLSYSLLRRATNSFSSPLGHGGFGTVFSGTLPPPARTPIAVKLMDPTATASQQGEREFHNELFFASVLCRSPHVVAAVGFSSDPKRRRFVLVYDLMINGNLQDALLHRKCPELMQWKKRFSVALDVAKGLLYLHSCDPPVIHGDIKPSNILLDSDFSAKIGDFGLARLKSETHLDVLDSCDFDEKKKEGFLECDGGGVVVDDCCETESANTGGFFEEGSLCVDQSPECFVRVPVLDTSPETNGVAVAASPETKASSVQSEKEVGGVRKNGKGVRSNSVRDWWWKHDNEVAASGSGSVPVGESKKVKDYVMEWIGKEVDKERPKGESVGEDGKSENQERVKKKKKKSRKQQLEWWESMEEEKFDEVLKKDKRRTAREWWKEEFSEELSKKNKKKRRKGLNSDDDNGSEWWLSDDATMYGDNKNKAKRRSRSNRGGVDWWLEGLSGDLWRARRNSYDSASGEIPKSGGVSSTPSMRGTVCYVAPEYGYSGDISEKCDVYSFGVLLLVIISGRRPLQVNGSPLSEFHRANLLSWARHCARNGKLIELVDQSIESLDKDQAILCIKVALLCLVKSPARRPSMKEVVGMLNGELESPQLPVEYSPSTPSRFPFKSRKKGR